MKTDVQFLEAVAEKMDKDGIGITQISSNCSVSRTQVWRILRGLCAPSIGCAVQIGRAAGTPLFIKMNGAMVELTGEMPTKAKKRRAKRK